MEVYKAINAVQADLCAEGITKNRRNQAQSYNFRGIDDVYNALSPLLAKHGLCILPRILTRTCDERATKSGGSMFYITVEAEFDFVAASDGSKHVVRTFGEAMDSADKATNKAMSAAYKYAAFQAFAIPTEGDNDADAHTPQVTAKAAPKAAPKPTATQAPDPKTPTEKPMSDTQRKQIMAIYGNAPRDERIADANAIFAEYAKRTGKTAPRITSFSELTQPMAAYLITQLEKLRAA